MRILAGLLGVASLLIALATGGLMVWATTAGLSPTARLGRLWFSADPASLNTLQVILERYLWPPLWRDGVFPILQQPGWLVAVVALGLGMLLLWLRRRSGGRPRRRLFSGR